MGTTLPLPFLCSVTNIKKKKKQYDNYISVVHTNPEKDGKYHSQHETHVLSIILQAANMNISCLYPADLSAQYHTLCIIHIMRYDEYNTASLKE
jgi:hypothetical protein